MRVCGEECKDKDVRRCSRFGFTFLLTYSVCCALDLKVAKERICAKQVDGFVDDVEHCVVDCVWTGKGCAVQRRGNGISNSG